MGTASRFARWLERGSPTTVGLPATGQPPGIPILIPQFGQLVWLAVQIAWGATPTSNMSTWNWTDVTHDVEYEQKIVITMGRQDESSTPQPADLKLTLKNSTSKYSYGPQSPNYPNVTKNVPVRVLISFGGTTYQRCLVYSTGFTPRWDSTGNYAVVDLTAAGAKRRLNKGGVPVLSVLTRSTPTVLAAGLVAYWPMEDGSASTQIAPGVASGAPMQIVGTPSLAASTGVVSSNAIPVLATGSLLGPVSATRMNTGAIQVQFMAVWPQASGQAVNATQVLRINTPGSSVAAWTLSYNTGGVLSLQARDANGNVLLDNGGLNLSALGQTQLVDVSLAQSGPNVAWDVHVYQLFSAFVAGSNGTFASVTLNPCNYIQFAPNQDQPNLAVGQCTVSNATFSIFSLLSQANGYTNEFTGTRMDRLAAENGEFLSRASATTHQRMGPQSPDVYINLMEGCAKVENGFLYDGVAQGMSFIAQDEKTSLLPALTLDASLGQPAQSLDPVDDDQIIINTYTASRTNGSSVTYTDVSSPLAATTIGTYSDSTTQNFFSDSTQLADYASWAVHQGTPTGYRWPAVYLWLHRDPELLAAWLATRLQSRIDIIKLNSTRAQLYNATVSLLLEGYTETIDQFTWSVATNTTPYDPWRVGEIAAAAGDTNEFAIRLDTDGASVVGGPFVAGTTSIAVSSVDTIWTTNSDDFPLVCNIGGQKITVTNITGSSSPQTFTLDGTTVTYPIPANSAVSVWQPNVVDVLAM